MPDLADRLQAHLGADCLLRRELTGGGMSRVFVAHERALDREVVVKLMSTQLAAAVSAERFRREIMLSAALQHPNIVPVLSAGEMEGLPYYVMPFIRGESLRARLQRGPLSIRETVNVLKDVARALDHAHARGIVHRDVKPDNILLTSGAATVADFGVAKAITAARQGNGAGDANGTMTGVGISLGTPAYMAPEQAVADPGVDHRADLYALGVVAYEMLAGVPPFHGRAAQALLAAHLNETVPALGLRRYDVPPALDALVHRLLAKDPAQRPKSAAQVLRALDEVEVASGAITAPADRPRARRPASPRVLWLVGGALAAVVAAAATWAAVRPPRPADTSHAVAIIPLRAVSGDSVETRVADGLASQLGTELAQVAGYRVTSQTTVRTALRETSPRDPLGAAVGAGLLVEGTVQRERDALRVNVRLVDAARDSTLWASTRAGRVDSLFALQDAVAQDLVAALRLRGSP